MEFRELGASLRVMSDPMENVKIDATTVSEEAVLKVTEMGFSREQALYALRVGQYWTLENDILTVEL